jgi:hypothetical protein
MLEIIQHSSLFGILFSIPMLIIMKSMEIEKHQKKLKRLLNKWLEKKLFTIMT